MSKRRKGHKIGLSGLVIYDKAEFSATRVDDG